MLRSLSKLDFKIQIRIGSVQGNAFKNAASKEQHQDQDSVQAYNSDFKFLKIKNLQFQSIIIIRIISIKYN